MAITTQINSGITVAYTPVCGGTTAAGPLQSVAALGSSGTVLTSNGAGQLPTFQAVPGSGILTRNVSLTVAQIQGAHATPVQLVAAQGANTIIVVLNLTFVMVVAGTAYANASNSLIFGFGASASTIQSNCAAMPITNNPFNGATNTTIIMNCSPMTGSVSGQSVTPIVGGSSSVNADLNFSSTNTAITGGTGSGNSTVYITYLVATV